MACQTMAMMMEIITICWSFQRIITSRPAKKESTLLSIPFSGL